MCKHLSRNRNQWRAVDHCVGQPGNQVGGTRPARCKHYTDFAGCARKTLRSMDPALFVPDQDMFQPVIVIIQCIINRHDGAAGVTENSFHALTDERFQYGL